MFHCNCLLLKIYVLSKVGYRLRYSSISVVLISGIFVLMLWFIIDSILFSSSLVLLINLDLRGFCFRIFFMCPHINSVNRGMPVLLQSLTKDFDFFIKLNFLGKIHIPISPAISATRLKGHEGCWLSELGTRLDLLVLRPALCWWRKRILLKPRVYILGLLLAYSIHFNTSPIVRWWYSEILKKQFFFWFFP